MKDLIVVTVGIQPNDPIGPLRVLLSAHRPDGELTGGHTIVWPFDEEGARSMAAEFLAAADILKQRKEAALDE